MIRFLRTLTKKLVADHQAKQLAKVRYQKFLNILEQTREV